MIPPHLAELAQRLELVAKDAPRNPDVESRAAGWIKMLVNHHFDAEEVWFSLGKISQSIYANAELEEAINELLGQKKSPFLDDNMAIAFYLGASDAALKETLSQPPGSKEKRIWLTYAQTLVAEAEAVARRLAMHADSEQKRLGAAKTNAKFSNARSLAMEVANDRWGEWQATRNGYCPRMTEVVKEVHRILAADPHALGLDTAPRWETIRQWLIADCAIPPEARQSGQRKRLE